VEEKDEKRPSLREDKTPVEGTCCNETTTGKGKNNGPSLLGDWGKRQGRKIQEKGELYGCG